MLTGKVHFTTQSERQPGKTLTVKKTENTLERTKGLLGSQPLSSDEGLWITPCNSVHTFGMPYALDIIYLNKRFQIRKIISNLKPRRLSINWFAKSVVELKAGVAARLDLKPGDIMHWNENA